MDTNITDINDLLEEHVKLSIEIKQIKQSVYDLCNKYHKQIELETDNDKKKIIFENYNNNLDKLRNNVEFTQKYKSLKKRKKEIVKSIKKKYSQANSKNDNSITSLLNDLLNKYENNNCESIKSKLLDIDRYAKKKKHDKKIKKIEINID
jgi:DNA-binding ferritin-like protein